MRKDDIPVIHQIIPAQVGWCAKYRESEGNYVTWPIAMWALVDKHDGLGAQIVGVQPEGEGWTGEDCEQASNFVAYVYHPQTWVDGEAKWFDREAAADALS